MSSDTRDSAPEDSTTDLARAFRAGDASRFNALYERLLPSLYAWSALRVPKGKTTVEDFLQEVWFRACRSLLTTATEHERFRAWMFGIAKNCLMELLRARVPPSGPVRGIGESTLARGQPDSTITTASRLARDEAMNQLLEYAATLEPEDRELLLRCGFEGKSCSSVAEQLDLVADAAFKRWQRLRSRMSELGWLRHFALSED